MEKISLELEKANLFDVFSNTQSYKNEDNKDKTVHNLGITCCVEIKYDKKKTKQTQKIRLVQNR